LQAGEGGYIDLNIEQVDRRDVEIFERGWRNFDEDFVEATGESPWLKNRRRR
jgi:hypothetical protein